MKLQILALAILVGMIGVTQATSASKDMHVWAPAPHHTVPLKDINRHEVITRHLESKEICVNQPWC